MLTVTNLSTGYGRKQVLHSIDFSVQPGSFTAILGRNGCGKSTLLSCLSGQLNLWSGSLSWNDTDLLSLPANQLAQTLALLPQGMPTPALTVAELAACGRTPWRSWGHRLSDEDRAIIDAALEQAGIAELAARPLAQLSGGERQRAWLAMTLAQDTPLLLLDEPTTYLDPAQQFRFLDTLQSLCKSGKTILAVLHDLPLALRYADQVILLDDGRCIRDGTPQDVLPALEQVFRLRARMVDGALVLIP